jgi:hypothetical protein
MYLWLMLGILSTSAAPLTRPCTDPRVGVYQFGSLQKFKHLIFNYLYNMFLQSGSLWIAFPDF